MTDSKYSMTDDGLMIKSTSLKDVGTYECTVKKDNVELKSRPAKFILEPDVTGCKYTYTSRGIGHFYFCTEVRV